MASKNKKKSLKELEKEFTFLIVDLFAREYGWSIEYIQDLQLDEVAGLLKMIQLNRENIDIRTQLNVNKGISGKISSNSSPKVAKADKTTNDIKKLTTLAKQLGQKIEKIEK